MSTLAKDLIEAQGQVEILKASLVTLTGERDQFKAKSDTLEAALKAEVDSRASESIASKAAIDDLSGKLSAEVAAHAETQKALAEANAKLADPAYQIAGTNGSEEPVAEGGQAAADAPKTRDQLEAEYRKIDGSTVEGAKQRADFRAKYKQELGL